MGKRKRVAALVLALLAAGGPMLAVDRLVESVEFDEAVRRAVENNHDVARAVTAILTAEGLLAAARAAVRPSVEIRASETVIDSERGSQDIVFQPKQQFSAAATVEVTVLDGSGWAARTQAADRVEIARLQAADVRRQIASAAAQTYLAIVAAQRQVEVDARARDNAQAQYDYARTRFENGAGSRLDELRAADELATSKALVERSKLAVTLSQESLGVLLAASGPLGVAGEPQLEIPGDGADLDLSLRTDLRLREQQRDAADRVLKDAWKDRLPDVAATFDPLFIDPVGSFQEQATWRAVLEARIPLYFGGAYGASRQLKHAALAQAQTDLAETELRAQAEVRSARASIEAARSGLAHAREAAQHANEVLVITDKALRAGARTNIELIDAQRRARDAESAAARAEDSLRQAKLDLLVALGLFGTD